MLVSVLMPVHNAADYVAASLQSILSQTHEHLEVVVVDDGSTDGSDQVVAQHRDARVRLLRQANAGPARARNTALDAARGDYVMWQDADDVSLPGRVETLLGRLHAAGSSQFGFAHSDMLAVDVDERPIGYWPSRNVAPDRLLRILLREGSPFNSISMLLRREVFAGRRFDERLRVGEDTDMIRQFGLEWAGVHVPEALLLYRRHGGNLSAAGHDINPMMRAMLAAHRLQELVPEAFSDGSLKRHDQECMARAVVGLFLLRRGAAEVATECFNLAAEANTRVARDIVTGLVKLALRDPAAALRALEPVTRMRPVAAHYRGEAYAMLGDEGRALAQFRLAIAQAPGYDEPKHALRCLAGGPGPRFAW